jgi:hypothetical protein
MTSMTPHVLLDNAGNEIGRCGMEAGVTFSAGQIVELGPMGVFRILDPRGGDPFVLVVEPTESPFAKTHA